MLLSFTVSNFRSIYSPVTLDLNACPGDEKTGVLLSEAGQHCLPVLGIYGTNASGKSTILEAFNFLRNFVIGELPIKNKGDAIPFQPFSFKANAKNESTCFCVKFTVNNTLYEYALGHDATHITHEHLNKWGTQRKSKVFIRDNQKFIFTKRQERLQRPLANRTIENRPYLFTSNEWNLKATEEAFLWFRHIPRIDLSGSGWPYVFDLLLKSPNKKEKLFDYLKKADFNIETIEKKGDDNSKKIPVGELSASLKEILGIQSKDIPDNTIIQFGHPIYNAIHKINGITATFNLEDESRGTRKYLNVIGPAIDAFEKGYILFFDEFQNSLHPLLARRIIEMFQDPEINTGGAQMVFVSHDATLLDQTLLRQDQIMFTDKSAETGETSAYRLSDIKGVSSKENILRGYLQGRYGAIPFLQ